jgi:MFS family permease
MMALGACFYMFGFGMYGFVSAYWLFLLAVVLITIGEMIVMPVSQALAAHFAPADMRGRYMAVFSLAWTLPSTFGPTVAGLILDNYNPYMVWYLGALICSLSVLSYLWLHKSTQKRFAALPKEEPAPA